MFEKAKALFIKYREIIVYLFFGGLTTLVSLGTYYLLIWNTPIDYGVAQWISWAAAVIFAFIVNKLFVFADRDMSKSGLFRQIWQFVSVRIGSGVVEYLLMLLMVEVMAINESIAKIPVSILTVLINYVASKLIIFKKAPKP